MKNLIILFAMAVTAFIFACSKDNSTVKPLTDNDLYAKTKVANLVAYKYTVDTPAAKGPHGKFVKVYFNTTVSQKLNSDGKLAKGEILPEKSLIVKEIFNVKGGSVSVYAVMYKDSTNENSASGWLWSEYNVDGTPAYSILNKGAACVTCHSHDPNRDLLKIFDVSKK